MCVLIRQLGIHDKAVGVLNLRGFFDGLILQTQAAIDVRWGSHCATGTPCVDRFRACLFGFSGWPDPRAFP
jgi:hypothetical protein